ncbi:MAG: Asp23/Gls24 family envelope stress response protein [Lachnospiraceae bacterium]|jgi:uncharacterized alkaline shock family protein YloU|nr:Asp23/Gls24 family envelope stress response protein [Lachnospiraceae bacterium]
MAQEKNEKNLERYSDAEIGTVKIADDVVALIAGYAALDVDGVSTLAGGEDREAISRGGVKRLQKSVKVDVGKEGVKADLSLVVQYGCSIPAVSSKVQARVKEVIESMTGLAVADVGIRVCGVSDPQ